ncbi:hypothetical protein BDM02DRAFT_3112408 [Thelephora ganbajun]|uniref:Uncharacterized protein n=1 Tax=Thelephora ganbajun TaxID=370292 RepID=A0ACB6ZLB6_THEGA|nr:hypothetical protein BDM02DRAFT_3112408 [Thelephora ganbajun]
MSSSESGGSSNQGQLRELAALAGRTFSVASSFCYSFVSSATRWSFSPFILVYPVISYLVAPFLVFAAIIINISILAPLSIARHLLNSLYPVYVFCGVACVTGIVVGMGGRGLSALLTRTFTTLERDGSVPTGVSAARVAERWSRRRRLRIKEEDT